jgi:GABA(A) receptor-associated protein
MATNFLELPIQERKEFISNLIKKNPKSIPVVLLVDKKSTIPELNKKRFLIPRKYKVTQLVTKLKKEGRLKSDRALYFFINNAIVK